MMGDTWGISGPLFLLVFLGLLIVPLLGWSVWSASARRERPGAAPVGPYEVAYLAGGRSRVLDTAVAALLERGQLRLSATTGKLAALAAGAQPTFPVEDAVWRAVAGQPEYADLVYLRFRLRDDPAITAVADSVVRDGLLVDPDRHRRALRALRLSYALVFLIGVVRVFAGVHNGHPVSLLVIELIFSGMVVLIGLAFASAASLRTRRGDVALRSARNGVPLPTAFPIGGFGLAAAAVAVGGLTMYPDDGLRSALLPLLRTTSSGSSDSWSSSDTSSSSTSSCSSSSSSCGSSSSCSSSSCSSSSSGCGG